MRMAPGAAVLLVSLATTGAAFQQPPRDAARAPASAERLASEAQDLYRARQWLLAADKYEAALAAQPDLVSVYFFLGHCYDNLYKPSRAGEAGNDPYLEKAIHNYQLAAERDTDPKTKKLAMEYLVAAYGPEKLNDPSRAEPIIQRMIEMEPADVHNYFALSKVYEDAGRYDDAERALVMARGVKPSDPEVYRQLSGYYNRQGDFQKTIEALHDLAELDPGNPQAHQLIATFYFEKAQKDQTLPKSEKLDYIQKGIDADDRALAINADYVEALTYKNILLRMKASETSDTAERDALLAEADVLRGRAMELNRAQKGSPAVQSVAGMPPPPPASQTVGGVVPVRVGGSIRPPAKLRHVEPVYPAEAMRASVHGMVIVDLVIDTDGRVRDARILRSIPQLDSAALDAVRQWEFAPTLVEGAPAPVAMTVTVTFSR